MEPQESGYWSTEKVRLELNLEKILVFIRKYRLCGPREGESHESGHSGRKQQYGTFGEPGVFCCAVSIRYKKNCVH